jgi:predicted MPP superfamily phosphohydrolase
LWIAFSILFLSLAGFSLWAIKLHRWDQSILSEYLIGNRASHVKVLEKEGFPFSFLLIGDIHNSLIGKALIQKALRDRKSFFMVILGDFVSKPDIWQHRYFLAEMAEGIKQNFPVFLVPGNHDIDYASSKRGIEGRVTPEVYDSLYGEGTFILHTMVACSSSVELTQKSRAVI